MEYIENCPNCDQEVIVEEDPTLPYGYRIKNKKGDDIMFCPSCRKRLLIVDGVMTVVKNEG